MRNGFVKAFNAFGAVSLTAGWIVLGSTVQPAQAGTVILEGSDSIGFHCGYGQAAACAYTDQTFSAIGGADPRPIAVVGTTSSGNPIVSGTHAIVNMFDLSTAGPLSGYAAILFLAGGGCCSSAPAGMAGRQADIATYVGTGGGTVEIGNYDGNSGWDFLTGGSGNAAFVAGIGGALGGPGCTDGETITALGTTNGFTQPGPVGCWTHQAYSQAHFSTLGFTLSFFDADPAFAAANPGFGPFSSLLSNGSTITGTPEPASIALLGVGLLGLAGLRRRKAA